MSGGLWIGTKGWGLYYFYEGIIKTFSKKDGLSDFISLIYKTETGKVIAASKFMRKIFIMQGNYFKEIKELRGKKFTAIASKKNILWLGTEDGLIKFYNEKIVKYGEKQGLTDKFIQTLFYDKTDRLWIGTYKGGINILKNGEIHPIKRNEKLKNVSIYTFYEDRENNIYIGTSDNLIFLKRGEEDLSKGKILIKSIESIIKEN